ncbi:doublesex- and mab-3-related transcription factor A2-like [Paramuricea clavata]|nr:doublesex- and mab-3-related transcription factor A2-like [Paramuricea clavata]
MYNCHSHSATTYTKDTREIKTAVVRKSETRSRHKDSGPTVSPKCARCKNHGVICPLKGHKGLCKWKDCICKNCSLIVQRQRIMAAEQSVLKEMADHKRESSLEASTSSFVSHESDNKRERKKKPISKSIRAISADNILQQLYLEKTEEIYLDSEAVQILATTTAGIVNTAWNFSFSYLQSSSDISYNDCWHCPLPLAGNCSYNLFYIKAVQILATTTVGIVHTGCKVLNLFYFKQFRWHLA